MTPKKVIFVLGPPGVGKGTQCGKISEKYGFNHVSAGELLRKELQVANSKYKNLIDSYMKDGRVIPAEITCKLLDAYIENSTKDIFLIDGFPRNRENREGWYKIIGNKIEILFVLCIDCSLEVSIERCLIRSVDSASHRFDDTVEIVEKRYNTFINETKPTLDAFSQISLVKYVDGNQSDEKIFEQIKNIFHELNFR